MALLWYTFQNISSIFCPNINSMLQYMKNDETVPIRWKNGLFLSFPESFFMFFTETRDRELGLVMHFLIEVMSDFYWKNGLFLSFPESFFMFFTETHDRELGLVMHFLIEVMSDFYWKSDFKESSMQPFRRTLD